MVNKLQQKQEAGQDLGGRCNFFTPWSTGGNQDEIHANSGMCSRPATGSFDEFGGLDDLVTQIIDEGTATQPDVQEIRNPNLYLPFCKRLQHSDNEHNWSVGGYDLLQSESLSSCQLSESRKINNFSPFQHQYVHQTKYQDTLQCNPGSEDVCRNQSIKPTDSNSQLDAINKLKALNIISDKNNGILYSPMSTNLTVEHKSDCSNDLKYSIDPANQGIRFLQSGVDQRFFRMNSPFEFSSSDSNSPNTCHNNDSSSFSISDTSPAFLSQNLSPMNSPSDNDHTYNGNNSRFDQLYQAASTERLPERQENRDRISNSCFQDNYHSMQQRFKNGQLPQSSEQSLSLASYQALFQRPAGPNQQQYRDQLLQQPTFLSNSFMPMQKQNKHLGHFQDFDGSQGKSQQYYHHQMNNTVLQQSNSQLFAHDMQHTVHSALPYAGQYMHHLLRKPSVSTDLHVQLEGAYEQFRLMERERRKTEADLVAMNPGRRMSSSNTIPIPKLPVNPSKVDRLIIDMIREHNKVITIASKIEGVRAEALHPSVESINDNWMDAIRKVEICRRDELAHQTSSHQHFGVQKPEDKYIMRLADSIAHLTLATRKARTGLWCALQLARQHHLKRLKQNGNSHQN